MDGNGPNGVKKEESSSIKEEQQDGNATARTNNKNTVIPTLLKCVVIGMAIYTTLVINLRLSLNTFCSTDESTGKYIVIKDTLDQCLTPEHEEQLDNSWVDTTNDQKVLQKQASLSNMFSLIPIGSSSKESKNSMCRNTHKLLTVAGGNKLLLGSITSNKSSNKVSQLIVPPVSIQSSCPSIIQKPKKKKMKIRGPLAFIKHALSSLWKKIRQLGKKKKKQTISSKSETEEEDTIVSANWLSMVSAPLDVRLTPKQKELVSKLRTNFKNQLGEDDKTLAKRLEAIRFGGPTSPSSFSWWFPADGGENGSVLLTSYLKIMNWPDDLKTSFPFNQPDCKNNGCAADFAVTNSLKYREVYKPWKMTKTAYEQNKSGWIYVRGYSPTPYHPDASKGGFSVLWYHPAKHPHSGKMKDWESYIRTVVNGIERCSADAYYRTEGKIGKCNIVLDSSGFGISMIPSATAAKKLLKMLQDHCPDKMGVFVILNLGGAGQMVMKLLSPFLPDAVKKKIHILPNDEGARLSMMKGLVDEKYIPVSLGGTDGYLFNAEQYYKSSESKTEICSDEEGVEYIKTMPQYS